MRNQQRAGRMAAKYMLDDMSEKSQAKLTTISEMCFEQRQALWKQTAPKRALADKLLLKLTAEDEELRQLMMKAHDVSIFISKNGPNPREPIEPKYPIPSLTAVTTVQLNAPWGLTWAWNSVPNDPPLAMAQNLSNPELGQLGVMSLNLRTDRGRPVESGSMAVGAWFQAPRSGLMTISADPTITYGYGNEAWLRSSHTHAWIGFFIQEWTVDGVMVQNVVDQQINLWDLTTDHDFVGGSKFSLGAGIPVISDRYYAIWVWAGGDVESNALSYGSLNVNLSSIFIHID